MEVKQKRYLQGFLLIVIILAIVRCACPEIAQNKGYVNSDSLRNDVDSNAVSNDSSLSEAKVDSTLLASVGDKDTLANHKKSTSVKSMFFHADGTPVKNRIYSVPNFGHAFPDQNDVQLVEARKYGVKPVADRDEAEKRKSELVYVGSNPYFYIDRLRSSIPYLVPRASMLLQDIGHSFYDSLQIKGVPLHKLIVTSVMRSKNDIAKLRSHNSNATLNSCHMYGTTFDVAYNRYKTVQAPGEHRREVRNDTLKWILSEVLDDLRKQNRCLVKYEVHQGCFHITVK